MSPNLILEKLRALQHGYVEIGLHEDCDRPSCWLIDDTMTVTLCGYAVNHFWKLDPVSIILKNKNGETDDLRAALTRLDIRIGGYIVLQVPTRFEPNQYEPCGDEDRLVKEGGPYFCFDQAEVSSHYTEITLVKEAADLIEKLIEKIFPIPASGILSKEECQHLIAIVARQKSEIFQLALDDIANKALIEKLETAISDSVDKADAWDTLTKTPVYSRRLLEARVKQLEAENRELTASRALDVVLQNEHRRDIISKLGGDINIQSARAEAAEAQALAAIGELHKIADVVESHWKGAGLNLEAGWIIDEITEMAMERDDQTEDIATLQTRYLELETILKNVTSVTSHIALLGDLMGHLGDDHALTSITVKDAKAIRDALKCTNETVIQPEGISGLLRPIKDAKKNTPILAWCDHAADTYLVDGGTGGQLTLYAAHYEGTSHAETGWHVLEWGGSFDDSSWEYPNGAHLPDWWFVTGTECEVAANPLWFIPLPIGMSYGISERLEAVRNPLQNRVTELEDAASEVISWIEGSHKPPVADVPEFGRMVHVRLHALANLYNVLKKVKS